MLAPVLLFAALALTSWNTAFAWKPADLCDSMCVASNDSTCRDKCMAHLSSRDEICVDVCKALEQPTPACNAACVADGDNGIRAHLNDEMTEAKFCLNACGGAGARSRGFPCDSECLHKPFMPEQ